MRFNFIVLRPVLVAVGYCVGFRMNWNDKYSIYEQFSNWISPSNEVVHFSPAGLNSIFKCINLFIECWSVFWNTENIAGLFFTAESFRSLLNDHFHFFLMNNLLSNEAGMFLISLTAFVTAILNHLIQLALSIND